LLTFNNKEISIAASSTEFSNTAPFIETGKFAGGGGGGGTGGAGGGGPD